MRNHRFLPRRQCGMPPARVRDGFAMHHENNELFVPNYKMNPVLWSHFRRAYVEAGQIIVKDRKLDTKFDMDEEFVCLSGILY